MTFTGPKNVTAQVGATSFMKCVVTGVSQATTREWRLSGTEYTPSTLPGRFFTNHTGLIINPVTSDDDGLTIQCFVVLFDPSVGFITFNSPVGVIHVVMDISTSSEF